MYLWDFSKAHTVCKFCFPFLSKPWLTEGCFSCSVITGKEMYNKKNPSVISLLRSSSKGSWQHFWQKDSFSSSEARHNYPSWHLFLSICIIYFWYLALMLTSSSWLSSDVIHSVQKRLNTNNLAGSMNSLTVSILSCKYLSINDIKSESFSNSAWKTESQIVSLFGGPFKHFVNKIFLLLIIVPWSKKLNLYNILLIIVLFNSIKNTFRLQTLNILWDSYWKISYFCFRTFSEINTAEDQYSLCRELCRDLAQDLQKEGLKVFLLFSLLAECCFALQQSYAALV